MIPPDPDEPEGAASRFLEPSTDIIGAVSGAAMGAIVGGPAGAIAGAGAGPVIAEGLKEFFHRRLSRREQGRIGAAYRWASAAFAERLEAGDDVRADGLMAKRSNGRSDWDEIVEGVLISAQRQHEERKVEYIGYMLANVAFEPQVDGYLANWAIRAANELTWAQFVLLSLIGAEGEVDLPDIEIGKSAQTWNSVGVHEQLADLGYGRRGLAYGPPGTTPNFGFSTPNLRLKEQKLANSGQLLLRLMWLDRISERDRVEVLRSLMEART